MRYTSLLRQLKLSLRRVKVVYSCRYLLLVRPLGPTNRAERIRTAVFLALWFVLTWATSLHADEKCARIVSFAPSITEILFDLGLGHQVVGVTNFCRFPTEAKSIPIVGGLYDVNIERVVGRSPTHVFMLKENTAAVRPLQAMNITPVVVDHSSLEGIKQSYTRIAKVCGVSSRAEQRLQSFAEREREIQQRCIGEQSARFRKTMVVVGRIREGNQSSGIYISGKDGFYSDVLRLVGAENVNTQHTVAVPAVSAEGIMKLAPEIILEIVNVDDHQVPGDRLSFWQQFSKVPAVQSKKVFLLSDDFASIPGPRYINLASKLSSILCPP